MRITTTDDAWRCINEIASREARSLEPNGTDLLTAIHYLLERAASQGEVRVPVYAAPADWETRPDPDLGKREPRT